MHKNAFAYPFPKNNDYSNILIYYEFNWRMDIKIYKKDARLFIWIPWWPKIIRLRWGGLAMKGVFIYATTMFVIGMTLFRYLDRIIENKIFYNSVCGLIYFIVAIIWYLIQKKLNSWHSTKATMRQLWESNN